MKPWAKGAIGTVVVSIVASVLVAAGAHAATNPSRVGVVAPNDYHRVPVVTVAYNQSSFQLEATPTSFDVGRAGRFRVVNTLSEAPGMGTWVAIVNGTGAVQVGSTSCNGPADCIIEDNFPNDPYAVVNVVKAGTVRLIRHERYAQTINTRIAVLDVKAPKLVAISIEGGPGTFGGRPGVFVNGTTVGIAEGGQVTAHVRFPGGAYEAQRRVNVVVDSSGKFNWQWNTKRKMYVYFANADGTARSDILIIEPDK